MRRITVSILVLLLLGFSIASAWAAPRIFREHVKVLPDDSQKWYLTVFYLDRENDLASRTLAWQLNNHPSLKAALQRVHLNKFEPGHPLYEARFRTLIGGVDDARLPAIVLQRPDGLVVYAAMADQLPLDADTLAREMARQVETYGRRPQT